MGNKLVICNDLDFAYNQIVSKATTNNIITYDDDEFKIEQARDLIAHAYIASENDKYIIVKSKKYNEVSQNALLKILEEPPNNINIILIGTSKAIFLPTIRSRLFVETIQGEKEHIELDFNLRDTSIGSIYTFAKGNGRFMDKNIAKEYVHRLFEDYKQNVKKPNKKILDFFGNGIRLIDLNSNPQSVIITLMLMINSDKKTTKLY